MQAESVSSPKGGMAELPLAGCRVIERSRSVAAAYAGRLLAAILGREGRKRASGGGEYQEVNDRIVQASIMDAPLRSFSVGGAPMRIPEAIALLLNGKIIKAVRKLLERDKR